MALGRATGNRDDNRRLPPLSLGLSSVRFIVNKIEAEYARVTDTESFPTGQELVKYDPNTDEGYDDYDDSLLVDSRGQVWNRFTSKLGLTISRCIPSVTLGNFGVFALTAGFFAPRMITYLVVYPFCRLVFGTLYPAYASYKAVRTKDLKEYVKWMMYWIVFALFTCTETFTDVFLSWFPFYYELKIVIVLWLLSPATKGSSILYRKFVHPALCRREQEIDEYIAKAKDQGYHTVLNLGTKGVNYATTVIMQTAIKGGGGLVQQLRKSYSLSDLTECEPRDERDSIEADDVLTEPRLIRRGGKSGYSTRRSASESNSRSPMYFPEVDVDVRTRARTDEPDFSHIKSSEDISSGYSSADNSASLTRTASVGAGARARGRPVRTTVTTIKRPQAAEDEVIIEEIQDDDSFEYANMPPLVNIPSPIFLSHTQPPFLYQYVGEQVKILQVLGNYPLNPSNNTETDYADTRDQNNTKPVEIPLNKSVDVTDVVVDDVDLEESVNKVDDTANQQKDYNNESTNTAHSSKTDSNEIVNAIPKEHTEVTSIASINENDSADSDDEASFGTPDNSPRSKRKSPKGKYGKGKAPPPPPPPPEINEENITDNNKSLPKDDLAKQIESDTSQESLVEIVNKLPNTTFKETGLFKGLHVVNPISENKRRHKSKSPARMQKGNSTGLGKLLQLPGKLAFWHKNDEKSRSEECDLSKGRGRSSISEGVIDDFQSCIEVDATISDEITQQEVTPQKFGDDQISFKDADDLDGEVISQDIIDKSDALQKLIEAKIESHPEYKYISLHQETPTSSKTTDV